MKLFTARGVADRVARPIGKPTDLSKGSTASDNEWHGRGFEAHQVHEFFYTDLVTLPEPLQAVKNCISYIV